MKSYSTLRVCEVVAVILAQVTSGRNLKGERYSDPVEATEEESNQFLLVLGAILLVAIAGLVVGCLCSKYKKDKIVHWNVDKKDKAVKEAAVELDGDMGGFKAAKKSVAENADFKAPVEERPSYANYLMKGADASSSNPKTATSEINEIM